MSVAKKSYVVSEEFDRFIEDEVASGRFKSESEVVEAALSLLGESATDLAELRQLIAEGDAQLTAGQGLRFTSAADFTTEIIRRAGEN